MVNIPNYYDRAVALLAGQFQIALPNGNLTNFQNLLYAILTQAQGIQTQLNLLQTNRFLYAAQGVQLDALGQIVGLARKSGQPDDSSFIDGVYEAGYRESLQFQIFANSADGTPEEMIYILKYLTNASKIWYNEIYPAAYIMTTDGINFLEFPSNPSDLVANIQSCSPAGVEFAAIIATYGSKNPFVFCGDPFSEQLYVAPDPTDITLIDNLQVNPGSGAVNLFVQVGQRVNPNFGGGFAEAIGVYPDYTYDNIGAGQMTEAIMPQSARPI